MPIIKSAIKKMRKDRVRTKHNLAEKLNIKKLLKQARRNPSEKNLKEVFSVLDKAAKHKLIHANKAARLKSRLTKQPSSTSEIKASRLKSRLTKTKGAEKTTVAKTAAKKAPAKNTTKKTSPKKK